MEIIDDSLDESSELLQKNNNDLVSEETPEEYKTRWKSIRFNYITMFFNSIVTTIVYSSLWAYLKQIDPETSTWFLGMTHAAFNVTELCCIILFGIWMQYRSAFEPLAFSLAFYIAGSALYAWALSFQHGKHFVLLSRALVGCASGNDVVITALLSEQTTIKERTAAMSYLALAQSLGFTLGPAIQALFVPIGRKGVFIKMLYLRINMYTAAGIACIAFGIINLICMFAFLKEMKIDRSAKEKDDNDNDESGSDNGNGNSDCKKPDVIAIVAVLVTFFITRHILVCVEVMLAPVAMDQYALSNSDTLLIIGGILAVTGILAAVVFILTDIITKKFGDRKPLVASTIFSCIGFIIQWPVGNKYPTQGHYYTTAQNTTHGVTYTRHVTPGCSPNHHWCKTTPVISIEQFAVSFTLLVLSFPVGYCILPSLFTKIIQPGRQGILISLFSVSGNLSRIIGPTLFTSIYFFYGPKGVLGLMDIGVFVGFVIVLASYKRLIPYQMFVKKNNAKKPSEDEKPVEMEDYSK